MIPGGACSGEPGHAKSLRLPLITLSEFPGGVLAEPRGKPGAARQTALLVMGEEGATAGIPARRTTCRALLTF